jgi:hypothetical protein
MSGRVSGHWLAIALLLSPCISEAETREVAEDAVPLSARGVLAAAFENLYEVNTISRLDLVIRDRSGQERRRTFHTVNKIIEDRLHSIGRLIAPEYLRGMTVMVIETGGQRHDAFVYLPSLGRVRRVTTAQRGDAFLGSDLTYEDFERQYVDDYDVDLVAPQSIDGEPCHVVRGQPRRRFNYGHVEFFVATSDTAILESRYYKRGADSPYRMIVAPRASMTNGGGHVLPKRILVRNLLRNTTTEVVIHEIAINPEIDDRLFSAVTLEQKSDLPAPGQ